MQDHVVDGHFLMPATSYIVMAWEALAAQLGRARAELAVQFEAVTLHSAVPGVHDGKITLTAEVTAAGHFEVSKSGRTLHGTCGYRLYNGRVR